MEMLVICQFQKNVIESASRIIDDFKDTCADLNSNIFVRKEVEEQMKKVTSKFLIKELEESSLDLNKTVSML